MIIYWCSCSLLIYIYKGNFVICNACVNRIFGLYESSNTDSHCGIHISEVDKIPQPLWKPQMVLFNPLVLFKPSMKIPPSLSPLPKKQCTKKPTCECFWYLNTLNPSNGFAADLVWVTVQEPEFLIFRLFVFVLYWSEKAGWPYPYRCLTLQGWDFTLKLLKTPISL